MKQNYYDIAGHKAWNAHIKAEALRYFFDNFQDNGSAPRDSEALAGIGQILEEISNEARLAHTMLDSGTRPPLETEVEDPDNYRGGYPESRIQSSAPKKGGTP